MNTTKKSRAIAAIESLIRRYMKIYDTRDRELIGNINRTMCSGAVCELCLMYNKAYSDTPCEGCPSSTEGGYPGCVNSDTYHDLNLFVHEQGRRPYDIVMENKDIFLNRAMFWEDRLEKLRKVNPLQFTRTKWKWFDIDNKKWIE